MRELGLRNPIAIIPNGIDIPGENREIEKSEIGKSGNGTTDQGTTDYGTTDHGTTGPRTTRRRTLLYLGRIHPKKGLVNLLRAWAIVQKQEKRAKSDGWVLAIAGWDQNGHEGELKRLASELGIRWAEDGSKIEDRSSEIGVRSSKIGDRSSEFEDPKAVPPNSYLLSPNSSSGSTLFFLGPRFDDEKAACYRECDGFILPSLSEGVPMVVLEAWAMAKPVLMTPECNLPEGFARNAAIRIHATPESIADGLRQLMCLHDSERQVIASNGLALARERFAWPRIAQDMRQVYEWMLGGGAAPPALADF